MKTRASTLWAAATAVLAVAGSMVIAAPAAPATLPSPSPVEQRTASTVTSDALPTVQIDRGVVWSQAVVGNTVYAGGSFSAVRPAGAAAGTSLTSRPNLLAYDIRTGNLITSFAPQVNGQVKVVRASPDGSRLYIGGTFTQVNGQPRQNVAGFAVATGALLTDFRPSVGGSYVNAIAATSSAVYLGGLFSAINGSGRANLGAVDLSGNLLGWAPTADFQVDSMVTAPAGNEVVIAGRFSRVNGQSEHGMAALDPASGAKLYFDANRFIQQGGGSNAGIWSLSKDANYIYGTSWSFLAEVANEWTSTEGTFSIDPANNNSLRWLADCIGDSYGSYSDGTQVYSVGHNHGCASVGGFPNNQGGDDGFRHSLAFTAAQRGKSAAGSYWDTNIGFPAPAMIAWYPAWTVGTYTGQYQAGWTVEGAGDYIAVGGEFQAVNGKAQNGLVRFARPGSAPKAQGPRLAGSSWGTPSWAQAAGGGTASIRANWDRDDRVLTYELYRSGTTAPVARTSLGSNFWAPGTVRLTDRTASPGQTYSYQVKAIDQDGNSTLSGAASFTASGTPGKAAPADAYGAAVYLGNPDLFWRLDEPAGTNQAADTGPVATPGSVLPTVTFGGSGAFGTSKAMTTAGSSGAVVSTRAVSNPGQFSTVAWFRSSSTTGGRIVGFGNSNSGPSSATDRMTWLRPDGKIAFGLNDGSQSTLVTPGAYNNGAWHQVVSTLSSDGARIYVDGKVVAYDPSLLFGQNYTGYWRAGGDNTWGLATPYLNGSIDEVAVYSRPLSQTEVAGLYTAAGGVASGPSAAFTATPTALKVAFSGSGSTAPSGRTITGYAWTFGDGSTGTGVAPSRTYAAAGTYVVTLTVTDSAGAKGSVSQNVTVTPAHSAPTAAFTATTSGLTANFSSAGSTATGATISGYAWTFGDGITSTEANPVHSYAKAGTYTATLGVTDSLGATSTVASRSVVVTAPAGIIVDAFGRTVASGWGSADTGGAWTASTGTSVGSGLGVFTFPTAAQTRTATLPVSVRDVNARFDVRADKAGSGGGTMLSVLARQQAAGSYRAKLVLQSNGQVSVSLIRFSGGTENFLTSAVVPGLTYAAGDTLSMRFQAQGTGTTTLRVRVWRTGTAEPTTWFATATDTLTGLQTAGQFGFTAYLSSTAANAPQALRFDNLLVTAP